MTMHSFWGKKTGENFKHKNMENYAYSVWKREVEEKLIQFF
jgi:hypothetical protein